MEVRMKKTLGIIMGALGIVLAIIGIVLKVKENTAVTIIGGADGPTSIFVAGKVGGAFGNYVIIMGSLFLVVAGVIFLKRRHKK